MTPVYTNLLEIPTQGTTRRGAKPDGSGLIAYYEFMLRLSRIRCLGYCTLTNADFADALGFHTGTGSSYLRRLKELGMVRIEYRLAYRFHGSRGELEERRIYPLGSLEDLIRLIGGRQ